MTHNRKPDVLPVEGASIAEALQYLVYVEGALPVRPKPGSAMHEWITTIRSALERSAAEGELVAHNAEAARLLRAGEAGFEGEYEPGRYSIDLRAWLAAELALPAPPKGSTP